MSENQAGWKSSRHNPVCTEFCFSCHFVIWWKNYHQRNTSILPTPSVSLLMNENDSEEWLRSSIWDSPAKAAPTQSPGLFPAWMAFFGWYHQLNKHEFKQSLGDSGGQRSLACFSPPDHKVFNMTSWLNIMPRPWVQHWVRVRVPHHFPDFPETDWVTPCIATVMDAKITNSEHTRIIYPPGFICSMVTYWILVHYLGDPNSGGKHGCQTHTWLIGWNTWVSDSEWNLGSK